MTTRELMDKVIDKPVWHFALAIYWRIALGYLIAYLALSGIASLADSIFF